MAMDGDALGDAIKAAIDALPAAQKRDRQKVFRAMGGAIVTYLTGTATVVSPTAHGVGTSLTAPAGGGLVTGTGKLV